MVPEATESHKRKKNLSEIPANFKLTPFKTHEVSVTIKQISKQGFHEYWERASEQQINFFKQSCQHLAKANFHSYLTN